MYRRLVPSVRAAWRLFVCSAAKSGRRASGERTSIDRSWRISAERRCCRAHQFWSMSRRRRYCITFVETGATDIQTAHRYVSTSARTHKGWNILVTEQNLRVRINFKSFTSRHRIDTKKSTSGLKVWVELRCWAVRNTLKEVRIRTAERQNDLLFLCHVSIRHVTSQKQVRVVQCFWSPLQLITRQDRGRYDRRIRAVSCTRVRPTGQRHRPTTWRHHRQVGSWRHFRFAAK